ncbi:CLUMA_CG009278, isoform A [Clunio marinus]|uniref:CLUMA_CG009278, isoform A n=1 Tax=Clunio marinus TaxID=568069 RepID=A0A1J1I7W2_9DIPT|nr:CLUMA_CG009278, isoform A [Clunio marinus]
MKSLIFVTVLVALSLKFETFVKADNDSGLLTSTVIFSKFDDNGSSNESDGTTGTDTTTEESTTEVAETKTQSPTESTRTDATTERTTREVTKTTEPSPTESTGTPFTDDELGSDEKLNQKAHINI